jgi:hypothetical protein
MNSGMAEELTSGFKSKSSMRVLTWRRPCLTTFAKHMQWKQTLYPA